MPTDLVSQMNKYDSEISELTFMDDDFSREVMTSAALQSILCKILDDSKLKLVKFEKQKALNNFIGRSACSDFYGMDTNRIHYIVELQNDDEGAVLERLRLLGSLLDRAISEPGDKWKDLQEIRIIMIARNDVIKGGQSIYHIQPFIEELSKKANMKITYIIVPINENEDKELGQLMKDLCEKNPHKIIDPVLKAIALYYKEGKGKAIMCKIMREVEERGRAEGKIEGKIEGKAEGELSKAIEIASNMLNELHLGYEAIQKCTGLSIEQIEKLYKVKIV